MSREALVVGINFYKKITGFNSLKIPSEDAAEIARILAEEGDFSVRQLPEAVKDGEIRVGQQGGVTQKELIDALKQLFIPKGKNIPDTALFYFAGHGILSEDGLVPEGYLVTSDATPGNWGVSLKQLRELLEGSEVRQQLIWVDCCHSGALLNFNQADPKDAGKARDRCFIAASREFELAYEQLQGNHGVLTGALLQGLDPDRCPAGQWVTNLSLVNSIHQVMEVERGQRKIPQRPVCSIFGEAINLIPGRAQPEKAPEKAVSEECPYQGLEAFEEEQKQFFFGRQQVIDKIRQKLNQKPFIPIIGASGSGKSSVVRAGLIPLLKERESGWRVLKPIKPGTKPLTRVRGVFEQFFQGAKKEEQLDAFIENDPKGLVKLIERLPGSERFLLVIDQFEEVFTVCPVEEDRRRFIELITQVAEIADSRLAVVTTMRADFLEPCLQYESLTQLIQNQAIYMPPLMGGDLEKAIAKPAELQGYRLEDGLLGTILKDVDKGAGSLPLLQFALTELWEKRDRQNHQLTLEQYQVMEGAIGSLNRQAQKVYTYKDFWEDSPTEERTKQEQEGIKRIVLKLVRTGQDEKDTRQRQPKGKLLAIAGDNPEDRDALNEVIDELVQGRLLVTGEAEEKTDIADSVEDAKMIDLAHEALMEGWKQFAEWRQEDRQLRRLIDRMDDAWREWKKERKDENLMMGGLLTQVRQEWQNLEPYLEPTLKDFYQRSDSHEQDRISTLERLLSQATLREQAARVQNLLPVKPLDGLVLAVQSIGLNLEKLPGEILGLVQDSLHRAMEIAREGNFLQGHEDYVYSVAISSDGQYIVSGSRDNTMRLWDRKGNPIGQPFKGHEKSVRSVAFSPDGHYIVSGSDDNTLRLWDINGNPIGQPFGGHKKLVRSVAFSPDGHYIVSGSDDNTLRLWDINGNPVGQTLKGHKSSIWSVAFSPDGAIIVSSSTDKTVRLWDIAGNPLGEPFQGHEDSVTSIAFSPDGQTIASGSKDKTVRLWDTKGNPIGQPFRGHESDIYSIAFSPDGQHIVSSSADKTVRLWDKTGNPISQPFRGHESDIYSVAFSPDGQIIVSASKDKTMRLWDTKDSLISQPFQGHENTVFSVAVSPDGQHIVTGSRDETVRLWDRKGVPIGQPFQGHKKTVVSVAFSPDGQKIVSCGDDETVRLWDRDGEPIGQPFKGHNHSVLSVAFSPDGQYIVSGGTDMKLRLWDKKGNPIGQSFTGHKSLVRSVAFSPDGETIVSGSDDKTVRLWNTKGNPIGQPFRGEAPIKSVAFSPDGETIISGSDDKTVRLWDTKGNPIGQPFRGHEDNVKSVAFSPDGQYIVSGSKDKTVRLWDTKGNPIGQPFRRHESGVYSVAFSPDGQYIVSASDDKTLRLWQVGWRTWLQVCCDRLRYHPVFKNPQTEVEKQACETCQKYVWSQEES